MRLLLKKGTIVLRDIYTEDNFILNSAQKTKMKGKLPFRTFMFIEENEVSVRCGYDEDKQIIYSSKCLKK